MADITITIDAQGNTTVAVSGHKGSGCKALTAELEKMLGGTTERKLTPEYAQAPQQGAKQEARR